MDHRVAPAVMPTPLAGARRALAVGAAALLLGGAGLPGAAEVRPSVASATGPDTDGSGPSVVVLRDAPLATHPGTRPATGQKVDTEGRAATAYTERLLQRQDAVLADVAAEPTYRYTTVLNGFAVTLTAAEAAAVAQRPDVRSVTPDESTPLTGSTDAAPLDEQRAPDTDLSARRLGLTGPGGVWERLGGPDRAGRGLVVAVLDTGVAWRNPSFSADAMPAPPARFTGSCETQDPVGWPAEACNNKIIGAQYFVEGPVSDGATLTDEESLSALDVTGYGSAAASVSAGRQTVATPKDLPAAEISGMAPMAHLAIYKICWQKTTDDNFFDPGCYQQDSIAGIEAATRDGVDILQFLPFERSLNYHNPVDLALRGAAAAGVFVAAGSGEGIEGIRVAHPVPWVTTVAGAYHRREFGFDVPRIASLASFGPPSVPEVQKTLLKPDIGAPGASVLAAVETRDGQSTWRRTGGTSLAAAHVAGIAGLQMQAHPGWSSMAIKSSLLTSARDYAIDTHPFSGGTGYVDPPSMLDTPLVFDSRAEDWDAFLTDPAQGFRLNSPSIQIPQLPSTAPVRLTRTLTNVSGRSQVFTATASGPQSLSIQVRPARVQIPAGASADVTIQVANTKRASTIWQVGSLTWSAPEAVPMTIPVLARGEVFPVTVRRLGGLDRYSTAKTIAEEFPDGTDTVYLASGQSFADGQPGSPAAAAGLLPATSERSPFPAPILLTESRSLSDATSRALLNIKPRRVVVLGGPAVISHDIVRTLRSRGYGTPRIAGADRYETAAKIALLSGTDVPVVYVASGAERSYPDALAGASAAARDGGPVLLVKPDEIPASVTSALRELRPARIVVLGGDRAVSAKAFRQLGADERIGGANRWETAALVSQTFPTRSLYSYVANGLNWPDALAGSVLAGTHSAPVLITEPNAIPAPIAAELKRLDPRRITILGGSQAVSTTVEKTLNGYLPWTIQ